MFNVIINKMNIITILVLALFFAFFLYIGYKLGYSKAKIEVGKKWKDLVPDIRKEAIKQSKAVLKGKFSEQLAPYFPDFPFNPTEARFIGNPVDFIVFRGISKNNPEEIVFVEVKTGQSNLSKRERKIRDLVKNKRVKWLEYRK